TPQSFDLSTDEPTVFVEAVADKRRREDRLPLPADVAAVLRSYLADKPEGQPVWPGTWHERAARMIKADLAAAGIEYQTDEGFADFHALRHTFITMLHASGMPLGLIMKLARHSDPKLTTKRYNRTELYSL